MITQKDIKSLKGFETLIEKIFLWMLFILPAFFLVMGALDLHLASRWGALINNNLSSLVQGFIAGADADKQYSGIYLRAMERITMALLKFLLALQSLFSAIGLHARRKLNRRLIETLRITDTIKSLDR